MLPISLCRITFLTPFEKASPDALPQPQGDAALRPFFAVLRQNNESADVSLLS